MRPHTSICACHEQVAFRPVLIIAETHTAIFLCLPCFPHARRPSSTGWNAVVFWKACATTCNKHCCQLSVPQRSMWLSLIMTGQREGRSTNCRASRGGPPLLPASLPPITLVKPFPLHDSCTQCLFAASPPVLCTSSCPSPGCLRPGSSTPCPPRPFGNAARSSAGWPAAQALQNAEQQQHRNPPCRRRWHRRWRRHRASEVRQQRPSLSSLAFWVMLENSAHWACLGPCSNAT